MSKNEVKIIDDLSNCIFFLDGPAPSDHNKKFKNFLILIKKKKKMVSVTWTIADNHLRDMGITNLVLVFLYNLSFPEL